MKLVSDRSVSLGDNARRIIVFERVGTLQFHCLAEPEWLKRNLSKMFHVKH